MSCCFVLSHLSGITSSRRLNLLQSLQMISNYCKLQLCHKPMDWKGIWGVFFWSILPLSSSPPALRKWVFVLQEALQKAPLSGVPREAYHTALREMSAGKPSSKNKKKSPKKISLSPNPENVKAVHTPAVAW